MSSQLIVKKEEGMFILREMRGGECVVAIKAQTAQQIIDYLDANYPRGTIARWIIVPSNINPQPSTPKPQLLIAMAVARRMETLAHQFSS